MEDWKKRAPKAIILLQFVVIVYLLANWAATREVLVLHRENKELRDAVTSRTIEACRVEMRLGQAYGVALKQLLGQLGIDKPESAAGMVLQAFNEGKIAEIPGEGDMGGCDDSLPECRDAPPVEKSSAKRKPKLKK